MDTKRLVYHFYLSNDYGLKENATKYFLDILGCNGRITFKYVPNGIMREAQTFYECERENPRFQPWDESE